MKRLFLLLALLASATVNAQAKEQPIALVLHGGAGAIKPENFSQEKRARYQQKLAQALNAGYRILEDGGSSLDAITASINVLEDSPLFNAGKGAVYNFEGQHDLDASIMEGSHHRSGAVAGVKTIKNPINLARQVMESSAHVLLAGSGAEDFAKSQGLEMIDNHYFDTEARFKALQKAKQKLEQQGQLGKDQQASWRSIDQDLSIDFKMGTVGAVAVDRQGNISAGTSTGGRTAKRFGRVGDSPIIGAGTWADNNSCGVSATGHGEFFIRYNVAADICARVKYQNKNIQQAADAVIHEVLTPVKGYGGVIVLNQKGEIAYSFNTAGMFRAQRTEGQNSRIEMFGQP